MEVEAVARGTPGLVATVGELTPEPGAPNVIPGRARLSLDVRHADDAAALRRDRPPARARRRDRRGAPGRAWSGIRCTTRTPSAATPSSPRSWSRRCRPPARGRCASRAAPDTTPRCSRQSRRWRCCSCAVRAGSATTRPSRSPRRTWRWRSMRWDASWRAWPRGIPPHARRSMTSLSITAGSHEFTARMEEEKAPATCAAFLRLLPFEGKLIHVRWSGESCWIPMGDFETNLPFENHTSHPAPRRDPLVSGRVQRDRDPVPLRRLPLLVDRGTARGQPLPHGRGRCPASARAGPSGTVGGRAGGRVRSEGLAPSRPPAARGTFDMTYLSNVPLAAPASIQVGPRRQRGSACQSG